MDSEQVSASECLAPSWLNTYQESLNILWSQMVTLSTRLFTLERLEEFPFALFLPNYDNRIVWQTYRNALFESIIMSFWRVFVDQNGKTLTIERLGKQILDNLLEGCPKCDQVRERINAWMQSNEYRAAAIKKKIIKIRHNYVAHLNEEFARNPGRAADIRVSLYELRELFQIAAAQFESLCLDGYYGLELASYATQRNSRNTDIDNLLRTVARDSPVLNMPECDALWREYYQQLKPEELATINEYRAMFGLSEVNPMNELDE